MLETGNFYLVKNSGLEVGPWAPKNPQKYVEPCVFEGRFLCEIEKSAKFGVEYAKKSGKTEEVVGRSCGGDNFPNL